MGRFFGSSGQRGVRPGARRPRQWVGSLSEKRPCFELTNVSPMSRFRPFCRFYLWFLRCVAALDLLSTSGVTSFNVLFLSLFPLVVVFIGLLLFVLFLSFAFPFVRESPLSLPHGPPFWAHGPIRILRSAAWRRKLRARVPPDG